MRSIPLPATSATRLLDGYLDAGELDKARGVANGSAELKRIVKALEQAGRTDDVLDVLAEIATIDPKDVQVRADLAIGVLRTPAVRPRARVS